MAPVRNKVPIDIAALNNSVVIDAPNNSLDLVPQGEDQAEQPRDCDKLEQGYVKMDVPVPSTAAQSCNSTAQCCAYCQREFASLRSANEGLEVGNAQRDEEICLLSQRVQEQRAARESLWELLWELQRGRSFDEALQETDFLPPQWGGGGRGPPGCRPFRRTSRGP